MEPKREPKWSPKASQDGTKKEKKSEVKLRELSEALEAKKRNERRSRVSSYEAAGGGKGRQEAQKSFPKAITSLLDAVVGIMCEEYENAK